SSVYPRCGASSANSVMKDPSSLVVIDEDNQQDAELRLVIPDMEVDRVHEAVAPAVPEDVLDQEVRRGWVGAVLRLETELIGHIGGEMLDRSVETLFRFRRERKAVQIGPFGVWKVDLKGQRATPCGRKLSPREGLRLPTSVRRFRRADALPIDRSRRLRRPRQRFGQKIAE